MRRLGHSIARLVQRIVRNPLFMSYYVNGTRFTSSRSGAAHGRSPGTREREPMGPFLASEAILRLHESEFAIELRAINSQEMLICT